MIVSGDRSCWSDAYRQASVCCPSTVENSLTGVPAGVAGQAADLSTGTNPKITSRNVNPPWVTVIGEIWLRSGSRR